MSKKNSIIFQITLFFFSVFVLINFLIYVQFNLDNNSFKALKFKRYFSVFKIVEIDLRKGIDKNSINDKISTFSMKLSDKKIEEIKSLNPIKIEFEKDEPIELFRLDNKLYVYFNPKPMPIGTELPPPFIPKELDFLEKMKPPSILLIDESSESDHKLFWLMMLIAIDITLLWFYYFLYKKFKPLIKLKNEINRFYEGDLNIDTSMKGKDEISEVSNEFNNAIEKIRDLNNSRKLFMRNILHELKTPITKGKLISDTLEEGRKKSILQRAFLRLEFLLEEFVKLEEITSGKIDLNKKEYRIVDLLDQSLDILLIDKSQVEIYSNLTKIEVDYDLFAISLKNLIDNAMKYKTEGKPEIVINSDNLIIKNHGKPLKKNFDEYIKPFNREYESIDKGLGLGLYITNNIIKHHGFNLYYYYSDDYHIFKIQF
ncbi:ArsS family sensor histidine kinase [Halarcobacter ebronensis]|uniref:ArsS family sensor histidine kinase n=1 Tax=Halarcobacter ebronensis TaxID=1462615 RepID=UPI001C206D53|nr:ArsS family sensor histidine kinase [Halarcobacter ebronensis]QKF82085.1 two-component system sensor histidine kinase [Halarcobacter ebronensis]